MKKARLQENLARRVFDKKLSAIVLSILVVGTLLTFVLLIWQKSTERVRAEYEGRVVDRWADYSESQQGSQPRFRLLIESVDGKRFTVSVDPNVYESSRVGMRIRSRAGQVVLIDSDRRTFDDK